jgi:hypothetical protein
MRRRPLWVGAALGLTAAGIVLALLPSGLLRRDPHLGGYAINDAGGAFRDLVIQYHREAAELSAPVYGAFLPELSPAVRVWVVCPSLEDFRDLRRRVGDLRCVLEPVPVGHAITTWSRDRWLAVRRDDEDLLLLAAREEDGQESWPRRKGDARVAFDLAEHLKSRRVFAGRTELKFDGGDFVILPEIALVTGRMLQANLRLGIFSREEIIRRLERLLGRLVMVLDEAPDHHMGMYVMAGGKGRVLVADPSLAKGLLTPGQMERCMPCDVDSRPGLQHRLDAMARRLSQAGLSVTRMPVLPGQDGRTWMTPLNVVLETRSDGKQVVYMPVYRGAEALNSAAAGVWESLGYEVRPIDCTSAYRHFGSLRCLVSVLDRGP